jgi:DNA-binding transcriptional LysR family regulator
VLRLGTGPTVSTTTALPIATFCALHPLARVTVHSRHSSAELLRQLRNFELDAAIAHFDAEQSGLEVVQLYEEQCVLLVSGKQLVPAARTITWREAAELPLALMTPDARFRQFIDRAFANVGAAVIPQVETDSMTSLYAHVATGAWAGIVPHTWFQAMPMTATMRGLRLIEPDQRAQISIAIHSSAPDSAAARAFLNVVVGAPVGDGFAYVVRSEPDPDVNRAIAGPSVGEYFVA